MTDPATLLRRMVDDLTSSGVLDPPWRKAFLAVPRHAFIPDTIWRQQRRELMPFHRADDPDRWLQLAYTPTQVLITQVDDGNPVGPGLIGDRISSSASQPNVVALMLAALDADSGMTVCEIGTGTGYKRAHWQPAETIEIDASAPILRSSIPTVHGPASPARPSKTGAKQPCRRVRRTQGDSGDLFGRARVDAAYKPGRRRPPNS